MITALAMSTVVVQAEADTDDIAAGGGPGFNLIPVVRAALDAHKLASKSHGPIEAKRNGVPRPQRPPFVQRHQRPARPYASLHIGKRSSTNRAHGVVGNASERPGSQYT